MKNKNSKNVELELFNEIVENNRLVETTVSEYEDHDYLASKIDALKDARIVVNNEMRGEGLRRTYVEIGRGWLEADFVARWKEESDQTKKDVTLRKARRKILVFTSVTVFLGSLLFYAYALYDGIKPDFGDSMKCVRSGDLIYGHLEKFANSVFSEVKTKDPKTGFSFWGKQISPELQAMWNQHLHQVKEAQTRVRGILIDPQRSGIYHIKCAAETQRQGNLEFRLQCAKIDGKYAVLALE